MKLIVLYCSRCTVVTRFFNLFRFCPYIKAEYPWNEVAKQIFFYLNRLNFSASEKLEEIWNKLGRNCQKWSRKEEKPLFS